MIIKEVKKTARISKVLLAALQLRFLIKDDYPFLHESLLTKAGEDGIYATIHH